MEEVIIARRLARAVAFRRGPEGLRWLQALPGLVGGFGARWNLRVSAPFTPGGTTSWTGRVVQANGDPAVLKVRMSVAEASREAAALSTWSGQGAIRVLRVEDEALLLELCEPGDRLSVVDNFDVQDEVAADLLRRLHRPEPADWRESEFPLLSDILAERSEASVRRNATFGDPVMARTLGEATRTLERDGAGGTLLHGDFQLENTLAARREPWLAVDPEAMVGAAEYDLVQYLLYRGGSVASRDRDWAPYFARLAADVGVDAELAQRLAFARLVHDALWALELGDSGWRNHLEVAELLRHLRVLPVPVAPSVGRDRLRAYGWSGDLRAQLEQHPTLTPARVVSAHEGISMVVTSHGDELVWNSVPPERRKIVTGDWVGVGQERFERSQPKQPGTRRSRPGDRAVDRGRRGVAAVLPRRSVLHRRLSAPPDDVIASHIDSVLVVMPLVPRVRLEALIRYVVLALRGGVNPRVVLTKVDLRRPSTAELTSIARAVAHPVDAISCLTGEGLDHLRPEPATTSVLVGPSGAGKSTLINKLFGTELQPTREVSRGGSGRHTTTASRLHMTESGAMYVDTPGVHQLGEIDDHLLEIAFPDLLQLSRGCRYPACGHRSEPDCAVLAAVKHGELTVERLNLFLALRGADKPSQPRRRRRGRTW